MWKNVNINENVKIAARSIIALSLQELSNDSIS